MSLLDIFKDIHKDFRGRIKNPLISALIISWFAFNYDFTLILFSNINVFEKVACLEEAISIFDTIIPLGIVLLIRLGVPRIETILEAANSIPTKKRRSRKNKEEIEALDHEVDKALKEFEIADARAGKKNRDQVAKEIEELSSERDRYFKSYQTAQETNEKLNKSLTSMLEKNNALASQVDEVKVEQTSMVDQLNRSNEKLEKHLDDIREKKQKDYQWLVGRIQTILTQNETIKSRETGDIVFDSDTYLSINKILKVSPSDIEIINHFPGLNSSLHPDEDFQRKKSFSNLINEGFIIYTSPNQYELSEKGMFLWLFGLTNSNVDTHFNLVDFLKKFRI